MIIYRKNTQPGRTSLNWLFTAGLVLAFLFFWPSNVHAENDNWQQWSQHNEASTEEIDHSVWNRLLQTYVSTNTHGENRFNYGAVSPADMRALKHYLEMLSTTHVPDLNKNEQLAFWINTYNAIIVQAVLKSYPVDSILDVDGDIFNRGPWKNNYFSVGGTPINLFNIRHNIIFSNWSDVRIIYALSCGAIGCPNIGSKAVRGKHVDGYLDAAAVAFINGPQAILKFKEHSVKISRLFYWSKYIFKREDVRFLEHIKSYAIGGISRKLRNTDHIDGYGFNWDLNEAEGE